MKRSLLCILFILFVGISQAQEGTQPDSVRILLVNPSPGDLFDMVRMIEQDVVPIDHPVLMAVYGEAVERRPEAMQSRLEAEKIDFVRIRVVPGHLDAANLFQRNDCTDAFHELFMESDAALFYGGADIPPVVYGYKTDLLTGIATPERHFFELSFLFHLLGGSQDPSFKAFLTEKPDYVVRGFCLGMQTMNVATGGTLYQDIPSEIYKLRYVEDYIKLDEGRRHDNYWSKLYPHENLFWCHFQPIRYKTDGFFVREMKRDVKEQPLVCSSHHQAVRKLGKDLQVAATSLDGKVVEAVTHKRFKNVVGVQFHPENGAIYAAEGGSKLTPADTALVAMHDYLQQKNSLDFHLAFWRQFNEAVVGGSGR